MRFLRTILLPALALASACSITPPPASFPAFMPDHDRLTDCAELGGHYMDAGEAFAAGGASLGAVSLASLFGILHQGASADSVDVSQMDSDVLIVTRVSGQERSPTKRYTRYTWSRGWGWNDKDWGQPFYCANGFLDIEIAARRESAPPAAAFTESIELRMRRGAEGSLLVLCRGQAVGLLLGLPFEAHRDVWLRFPPRTDRPLQPTGSR